MLKKILAALLVAGTVLTLAACDKDNKKQPDSKTPDNKVVEPDSTDKTNTDAIDYDADRPLKNTTATITAFWFARAGRKANTKKKGQEDVVKDAIYRRNKDVEEKYGITISVAESSSSDYEVDALNSVLARR